MITEKLPRQISKYLLTKKKAILKHHSLLPTAQTTKPNRKNNFQLRHIVLIQNNERDPRFYIKSK